MERFAIHFNSHITLADIADALHTKGIHLRCDANGKTLADAVPAFLRREAPPTNVVKMPARVRKVAR